MDFRVKSRTWVGNIYHKFETMCQEVDDFVTKDSMKYVENQVHTVGESMKKIYSNVVHDFLPPVADNKPNEGQLVTKKQNDVLGTHIRSMVGMPGKHGHADERKYCKEQGNASEQGQQRQHSFPPNSAFCQQADTDFYSQGGGKNANAVHEENVTQEEIPVSRFSSSQDKKSSVNLGEQHSLSESLDSSEDENVSGPSEISNEGEQRNIFMTNCSPEKIVDGVDGVNAIDKSSKMGPEENANKDHPASEGASSFKEKDSSNWTSCTKEQYQKVDDSQFVQDENSLVLSLANEDFKRNIQVKLSPVISTHDKGFRVVQMAQTVCDNADPSKEAGSNFSLEQHDNAAKLGTSLEEDVAMDILLVVDCKSFSKDESHLKFSLQSYLKDENFSESPLTDNPKLTIWDKFPPETSVHVQELKDIQDKESLCDNADPLKETKRDLSLEIDADSICMYTDLARGKNHMHTKCAVDEPISFHELKSSSDLSLYSRKLHLQAEELGSLEDDNLLKPSPPSGDKDHKNTILTNFSQAMSIHDVEVRASRTDGTICRPNPHSGFVSSNICVENKTAEAEVTALNSSISMESLNLPEISHANYTQKAENSCCNYTDSSSYVSNISSISSGSFFDLTGDSQAVNPIPAFLSRAVSAVSGGDGDDYAVDIGDPEMETIDLSDKVNLDESCGDDYAVDIGDPEMETIDLSDKANLDESCIIVDNRLHYAASSRPRKFRSYKKLLQDAFASRKRLIKEYEQLAIWYGDIETEICPRPKQSILPPVTSTNSSSATSQTSDMCEPEWELL